MVFVRYISLDDALRKNATICIQRQLVSEFKRTHPGSDEMISPKNFSDTLSMLDALNGKENIKECDAVVTSFNAFQHATKLSPKVCDNNVIITFETVLSVSVVIPISPALRHIGSELGDIINRMISTGWFEAIGRENYGEDLVEVTCAKQAQLAQKTTQVDFPKIMFPAIFSILFDVIALYLFFRFKKKSSNENNETEYDSNRVDIRDSATTTTIRRRSLRGNGSYTEIEDAYGPTSNKH